MEVSLLPGCRIFIDSLIIICFSKITKTKHFLLCAPSATPSAMALRKFSAGAAPPNHRSVWLNFGPEIDFWSAIGRGLYANTDPEVADWSAASSVAESAGVDRRRLWFARPITVDVVSFGSVSFLFCPRFKAVSFCYGLGNSFWNGTKKKSNGHLDNEPTPEVFCRRRTSSSRSGRFPFSKKKIMSTPRGNAIVCRLLTNLNGFCRVLLGHTLVCWVLFWFTRVLPSFLPSWNGFDWVLSGFTGFYWVGLCFTGFYLVLTYFDCVRLGFVRFNEAIRWFTGFYLVLPTWTVLDWVLSGFTGLYFGLLGLT